MSSEKAELDFELKHGLNSEAMDTRDEALSKAITLMRTSTALAAAVGVKPQAVSQWERVPVGRVLAVEAATGIPRHELRPDIYPPPTMPQPAAPQNSNVTEALPS